MKMVVSLIPKINILKYLLKNLYISKKIIEAHGGKIWGKNNDYNGIGAEFGFILPIE